MKVDNKMANENQKILLLLDNVPLQILENIKLSNVEVLFLPLNTILKIEPMDAKIIAAFKNIIIAFNSSLHLTRMRLGRLISTKLIN